MFAVDLHTHTRFFHGHDRLGERFDPLGYRALSWVARRRGLDAVALTNHDYYRPLGTVAGVGTESSSPTDGTTDPVTVPGIEISTTHGHVLVVGPDPPARTEPGSLSPREAVALAHDRGCAAIIAHPYRNSTVQETDVEFDAIEVNGKHPWTWSLVEEIASDRDLPLVGGSDAHYPVEVGRAHTLVDADRLTPESVVAAIREDRVDPAFTFSPVQRALHALYRTVHLGKDHVDPVAVGRELERVERERSEEAKRDQAREGERP